MKKLFLTFSIATLVLFPLATYAQLGGALTNLNQAVGSTGLESNLSVTIGTVIRSVLALVGTIFLILTIYAGILWMTASGNEEQVTKAKNIIKATVIGLAIVMSAYAITFFVTSKLGGGSVGGGESQPVATCADVGGQCVPIAQAKGKTIIGGVGCAEGASYYCVK